MGSIVDYPDGSNQSTRVVIKGSELRVREEGQGDAIHLAVNMKFGAMS